jgi:hypothetical protein
MREQASENLGWRLLVQVINEDLTTRTLLALERSEREQWTDYNTLLHGRFELIIDHEDAVDA